MNSPKLIEKLNKWNRGWNSKVLKEYLPQQLSEEELNEIVNLLYLKLGATSMKDMGKIMSVIRPKVKKCERLRVN